MLMLIACVSDNLINLLAHYMSWSCSVNYECVREYFIIKWDCNGLE